MPIASITEIIAHADKHPYAVGYFESWNLESLLAVKDAAEESQSPVIVGFNGGFIENPLRQVKEDIRHYGSICRSVADTASVPVGIILNEARNPEMLLAAIDAGFNAVMLDCENCSHQDSIKINRDLVIEAHRQSVFVEAEIGRLPEMHADSGEITGGSQTDVEAAIEFVEQTNVDALAISVGNVHLLENRQASLNLDLIEELRNAIGLPLVLHGGSGIGGADLAAAIEGGVRKINVGTVLRRTFVTAISEAVCHDEIRGIDAGELTSTGGSQDILAKGRLAVCREVAKRMALYGSAGMAWT